jgi:hypothetical protein
MGTDYKGITATHKELREAGYFHTAKLIILRNLYHQTENPSLSEKGTAPASTNNSLLHFKSPTDKIKSKGGKEKTCLNTE